MGNNKCSDQPADLRSLISDIIIRSRESIIPNITQRFNILTILCRWADCSDPCLVENAEDRFSRTDAQFIHWPRLEIVQPAKAQNSLRIRAV